ncbi:ribonucleoside reductase [Candidatus Gottesmanbacteria bacterium]|nr:ribonucleoside reductase [Candidatus Gottesmanbacteria bacterium]
MKLDGIRQKVFLDRYSLKDKVGNPLEKTPEAMWKRIAKGVAQYETDPKKAKVWEKKFYMAMQDFKYIPGGRILSGAGTGYKVTFYNCYVLPSPKDSRDGILDNLKEMVEIMARGGGVGINLSSLRPRGARVKKVNGFSSGPMNWAELYSVATHDIIQQGGTRRGALMLMLWDWHPDIEEFITVKRNLARITGANLSVCVSDKFMKAVQENADWNLVFPDTNEKEYDQKWDGYLADWVAQGKKVKKYKTVKAKYLWDLSCEAAWTSAEPGVVFMERYNKWHSNYYFNRINCVNPCVTGDTLVSTSKGQGRMEDLYKEGKPFLSILDGKPYLTTAVKHTGVKQVYKLKTKEGYSLRLTSDHKVYTQTGMVEAGKLTLGTKLILTRGGSFGTAGTEEEGLVYGWLVGDGSVKKDVATLYFYNDEKRELAPSYAQFVHKMVDGTQISHRSYPITPQYVEKEDKAVVESTRLWRMANKIGLTHENKYQVPEMIFAGSKEIQKGFLKGLFSSDGHVSGTVEKGISVRLTSVSQDLLVGVQRLLLNFGITSRIYANRRQEMERLLPDGKGGRKLYRTQAYHDLVISKSDLLIFAREINFLQKVKQVKLASLLSSYKEGPYRSSFTATFDSLEKEGIEDVYDITVADVHRFSANGIVVSNCGEEGLPAYGVCNLGSLNLAAFVKDGKMDYELLYEHAKIGTRFQDNIIDGDIYIFEGIRKTQLEGERRIGLGTMGLGDALIKMKIRYGSQESLKVIDKIYKLIRDAAFEASIELAQEKGAFPKFEKDKYLKAYFIKQLPVTIKKKISKYGIRNSVLLMQAPTGSTSLMAGVSSGIEPVYEFTFIRRDRLGEHRLYHPLFDTWKKDHPSDPIPDYFVSSSDLTPEDHVKVQAAIQKYVDASISKTVNAPKTFTVDDVKKLYNLAYKLGCKGVTFMRDGSRPGVLEKAPEKQEAKAVNGEVKIDGIQIPVKKPRPMVVHGSTYQIDSPVGITYVTINSDLDNQPFEVFITVGKAGSDVGAMADAIGRLISLNLRMVSPLAPKDRMKKIADQLIGIGGARSVGFGEKRVRSLPDAVAKIMATHFGFHYKNGNGEIKQSNGVQAGNGHLTIKEAPVNSQPVVALSAQNSLPYSREYDLCPECGSASLALEEGCKKCYSCGYSEC